MISTLVALLLWGTQGANTGQVRYQVVHDWPKMPENTMFDEVSAVAVDSHNNVFVLTRAGRKWPDDEKFDRTLISAPTISVFEGHSGKMLRQIGKDVFALPHSITIDRNDNIWVSDVALDQVIELSPDGRTLRQLGTRSVAGVDETHFDKPSDVAIAKDGSIYVSDGYGNNRIVEFSSDGRFIRAWGTKGTGNGELNLPHSLALDDKGNIFVMDRENSRIQEFDPTGRYVNQWTSSQLDHAQTVRVGSGNEIYVANAGSEQMPDRAGVAIFKEDGTFLGHLGRFGNYDGQVEGAHWVAVGRKREVYIADFEGKRVEKFVRVHGQP